VTHVELAFPRQPDDRELVDLAARAAGGDATAFEGLALRVRALVTRWAESISGDPDEADDVAQVVLLRLYDRVDEFEGRSQFTSWLYRIVRNVSFARQRLRRRREALLERHGSELVDQAPPAASRDGAIVGLAERSLGTLPGIQRTLFVEVDLRGRRVVDVATELRINPVTARGYLMRARRTIRVEILAMHPDILSDYTP
jgi:RNA polymerase sigma-70 factor (ECF subfamily)